MSHRPFGDTVSPCLGSFPWSQAMLRFREYDTLKRKICGPTEYSSASQTDTAVSLLAPVRYGVVARSCSLGVAEVEDDYSCTGCSSRLEKKKKIRAGLGGGSLKNALSLGSSAHSCEPSPVFVRLKTVNPTSDARGPGVDLCFFKQSCSSLTASTEEGGEKRVMGRAILLRTCPGRHIVENIKHNHDAFRRSSDEPPICAALPFTRSSGRDSSNTSMYMPSPMS